MRTTWTNHEKAVAAQQAERLLADEERAYTDRWLEEMLYAPQFFRGRCVEAIVFYGSWEDIWELRLLFYWTWDKPLQKLLEDPRVAQLKGFVSDSWNLDAWISKESRKLEELCSEDSSRNLSILLKFVEIERLVLMHLLCAADHDVSRGYSDCSNPGYFARVKSSVTVLLDKLTRSSSSCTNSA